MAILKVFKSRIASVNFILPTGKVCVFKDGVFRTNNPYEIAQLMAETSAGHPHIYVDPEESEIDERFIDPIAKMKHEMREAIFRELQINDPQRDMGTSDQSMKLNVANSRDIQEAAMGHGPVVNPVAGNARLMALRNALNANANDVAAGKAELLPPITNIPTDKLDGTDPIEIPQVQTSNAPGAAPIGNLADTKMDGAGVDKK